MQATKKRPFLKQLRRDGGNYVLLAPALLYTVIFGYLTYPYMAVAFERFDYSTGIFSEFVGFKNVEAFFNSTWAWLVTGSALPFTPHCSLTSPICCQRSKPTSVCSMNRSAHTSLHRSHE